MGVGVGVGIEMGVVGRVVSRERTAPARKRKTETAVWGTPKGCDNDTTDSDH